MTTRFVHTRFDRAFVNGTRFKHRVFGRVTIEVRTLATLKLPSGRMVLGDPFEMPFGMQSRELAVRAPIGAFPVDVAIAHLGQDARVACARVRFSNRPAVRWDVAYFADSEARLPTYVVDSGTGCFVDRLACNAVTPGMSGTWVAAFDHSQRTWGWLDAKLSDANIVMFSTGAGDGQFLSFWGYDAKNELAELVTDFETLMEETSSHVELTLPLVKGALKRREFDTHQLTVTATSPASVAVGGEGLVKLTLSDGARVLEQRGGDETVYSWKAPARGTTLSVEVLNGGRACDVE